MTTEQPPTPAGWYPDQSGGPGQMYWDGPAMGHRRPCNNFGVAPYGDAAYGLDAYGRPLSDKSKLVAGLPQIFLPSFGVGRFYLGYTNIGILHIAASFGRLLTGSSSSQAKCQTRRDARYGTEARVGSGAVGRRCAA